jgi:hypothetical protein
VKKQRIDITGRKYGLLTVLEYSHTVTQSRVTRPHWVCLCDCGNTTVVMGHRLKSGNTTSCGCQYNKTSNRESEIMSLFHRYPEGHTRGELHERLGIPLMSLDRVLKRMVRDEKLVKVGVRSPRYGKRVRPVAYIYLLNEWDGQRRNGYQRPVKPKPTTLYDRIMEMKHVAPIPEAVKQRDACAENGWAQVDGKWEYVGLD